MHNAPAVSYPAGRSSFAGACMLCAWTAGVGGIVLWTVQVQAQAAIVVGAMVALAAAGAVALRAWRRSPSGVLSWDGVAWTWSVPSGAHVGEPLVVLDAQRVLLLRWAGSGSTRWLWLERSARPARWDDLRRAVYSRPTP